MLDLYATAVDYDSKDEKSIKFFKIVQNKLHYAAHGHTAPEVIYERADSEKPFMGLKPFKGDLPILRDAVIAKNYLDADRYNSKLERVLRYSIHLLLHNKKFNLVNFRKLLTEIEYRNKLLKSRL